MARAYTAGDVLPFGIQVYDENDDLANAGTVTIVIVKPDGTETSPVTVSPAPTGTYGYSYATPSDAYGVYLGVWDADGSNAGGEPQSFYVLPARPPVTLGEMKSHLEVKTSNDDAEIASFLGAAIQIVEGLTGPILPVTRVRNFSGGRAAILLDEWPMTITQVKENGSVIAAAGYTVDDETGILYRGSSTGPGFPWSHGQRNIEVTYTAGTRIASDRVRLAIKELMRYMWRQVHGNPASFQDGFISQAAVSGVSAAMLDRIRLILGDEVRFEAGR